MPNSDFLDWMTSATLRFFAWQISATLRCFSLKMMTTSKMKTTSKIKSTSKIKMTSKMKTTLFQYRLGLVVARHCVGKNREGVKIRNSRNESYIKREAVKTHQNYNNKKFSPKSQLGQELFFLSVCLSVCVCPSVC